MNNIMWSACAPANIALIKYMGKSDSKTNSPLNSSLSYTLDHYLTFVELELTDAKTDSWQPLVVPNNIAIEISENGQLRFLHHLQFLKNYFGCHAHFIVRSGNNFPADCGLASSASSYAALTRAACKAICELCQEEMPSHVQQACLSQSGSGSSCRSFFSPWCLWTEYTVNSIELPYKKLFHQVIIVDKSKKTIASSEAHRLVTSSDLYPSRKQRAETRLQHLLVALQNEDWHHAYLITWQEFWDMHALFETCSQPFGYMTSDSLKILTIVRDVWKNLQDGPLVTMDAGANVHLLYRKDQLALANQLQEQFELFSQVMNYV